MVRMITLATALALFAGSAVAQTQQFDLICSGEKKEGLEASPRAHTERYRIDLVAGRWCQGTCESVFAMKSATPDLLTLHDEITGSPLYMKETHTISRVHGQVSHVAQSLPGHGFYWSNFKGQCVPAPFSGLPVPKF